MRHPSYSGDKSPDLSCKTCCEIYIANIVAAESQPHVMSKDDAERWLEEKYQREAAHKDTDQETVTFLI